MLIQFFVFTLSSVCPNLSIVPDSGFHVSYSLYFCFYTEDSSNGGAIYIDVSSQNSFFQDCIFAYCAVGDGCGGGMYVHSNNIKVTHCFALACECLSKYGIGKNGCGCFCYCQASNDGGNVTFDGIVTLYCAPDFYNRKYLAFQGVCQESSMYFLGGILKGFIEGTNVNGTKNTVLNGGTGFTNDGFLTGSIKYCNFYDHVILYPNILATIDIGWTQYFAFEYANIDDIRFLNDYAPRKCGIFRVRYFYRETFFYPYLYIHHVSVRNCKSEWIVASTSLYSEYSHTYLIEIDNVWIYNCVYDNLYSMPNFISGTLQSSRNIVDLEIYLHFALDYESIVQSIINNITYNGTHRYVGDNVSWNCGTYPNITKSYTPSTSRFFSPTQIFTVSKSFQLSQIFTYFFITSNTFNSISKNGNDENGEKKKLSNSSLVAVIVVPIVVILILGGIVFYCFVKKYLRVNDNYFVSSSEPEHNSEDLETLISPYSSF